MANGIAIKDVDNKLQSLEGEEVIPISTGADEPEVVEVDTLKEYINEDVETALEGKQDVINDLDTIRSGAALGATAYQKPGTGIPSTDLESGVIPDVSGFITNTVDDLVNYYTKIETYSQTEVQQLINAVKQFTYELVSVLPAASASTMNKIYLVPSSDPQTQNIKDEYITINSSGSYSWEQIGSTAIDLSDYVTTTALNTALADYTTSTDLSTLLAGYQTKIDSTHKLDYSLIDNTPTIPDITNCVQKSETAGLIKNDGTVDTNTYLTSAHEVPSGGNSGQILKKTSGSDYAYGWGNITETFPSAYCTTAGGTATKVANCSLWTNTPNTYLHILMGGVNTYQGELKLKVNALPSAGATIYINGTVSSSTNYTLPAGSYIIFYDGTNFYFNTQGKIPTATSVLASVADIPDVSNYVQKNSTSGLLKNDGTVDTSAYITSSQGLPAGGNQGRFLVKASDNDYDCTWQYPTHVYTSAYCDSSAISMVKGAECTGYWPTANTYLHIVMKNGNTYADAFTLRVNGKPACPVYINGVASSSTNYTLPAGSYIIFYDGTNYYFRTDGKIPTATSVLAAVSDLPTVMGASGTNHASGLVPDPGSTQGTTKFLREDGSWQVPPSGGGGEVNTIESISVNTVAQTPDANKNVDITVPDVSGKEDSSNKVTSLSSSSTDTQYPSAKCVFDLVGDIETILASI